MIDKLFRQDFWIKVLAVALAVMLWAMVMTTYSEQTSRSFEIPLTVIEHPVYEVFEGYRNGEISVEVRAEGTNLVISRLRKEDFKAVADYSKLAVTDLNKPYPVEIRVVGPERGNRAEYHVNPKNVQVTLVEKKIAVVPLRVAPKSDVIQLGNSDYTVTARVAETVEISGRSDFLDKVKYGQVTLEPSVLKEAIGQGDPRQGKATVRQRVVPMDVNGAPVEKLSIPFADVEIAWEELPPGRLYRVQPITRGTLAPGYALGPITVEPENVIVRAATFADKLPEGATIDTFPIDLTDRNKTFTSTVPLLLPQGTTAARDTVNVTVTITESTVERVIKGIPVEVTGRAEDAEVTLAVTDVQVRLKGPYSLLNNLPAEAIKAIVDVEGLREGRHVLPITVSGPKGLVEQSADPASVEVTITATPVP